MQYLRVTWLHTLAGEPTLLLSELNGSREEVRKIEIYADGRVGFAEDGRTRGDTRLSETPLPPSDELAADPQFVPESISKAEFEEAWRDALSKAR